MHRVAVTISFCYGHRLLRYAGKCRHLHGHNARAVLTLEASGLDEQGMVCDFSHVKGVLGRWIDEHFDHRLILHEEDPLAPILRAQGEPVVLLPANPTAENLAQAIYRQAATLSFPVVEVQLWESDTSCATYREPRPGT